MGHECFGQAVIHPKSACRITDEVPRSMWLDPDTLWIVLLLLLIFLAGGVR